MRSALVLLALALAVGVAAVAASLVLLGSTRGNDRVGKLSPVATIAPAPTTTHDDHHGGDEEDD
jgi:hypothetical protein